MQILKDLELCICLWLFNMLETILVQQNDYMMWCFISMLNFSYKKMRQIDQG